MTAQSISRYSPRQLSDDDNYITVQQSRKYFPWIKSDQTIRDWLRNEKLVGRSRDMSDGANPRAVRWEVFFPDIEPFKKRIHA